MLYLWFLVLILIVNGLIVEAVEAVVDDVVVEVEGCG